MTLCTREDDILNLSEGDYVLVDEAAWLTIKGFAVWVRSTDEGIVIDVFKNGSEMDDPIAGTYAFDSDLLTDEEKPCNTPSEALTRPTTPRNTKKSCTARRK